MHLNKRTKPWKSFKAVLQLDRLMLLFPGKKALSKRNTLLQAANKSGHVVKGFKLKKKALN